MGKESDRTIASGGGKFLTFRLEQEIFGVPIDTVWEVLDFVPVTRVPGASHFLKGVINLRGAVVPVADVRIKFGMPAAVLTENSCIIVVEIEVPEAETKITVGILADQVMEVAELPDAAMQPHPDMGTGIISRFLRGMGKLGDHFFTVHNMDAIISDNQEDVAASSLPRQAECAGSDFKMAR